MNINFFFETILVLFSILASNGFIYSLTFFHSKKKNSSENISVKINSSEKEGLALTSLIASSPIRLTSSESSASQTLSVTSSETNVSQDISVISSETNVSQDIFENGIDSETNVSQDIFENGIDSEITEVTQTGNDFLTLNNGEILSSHLDALGTYTARDSATILDAQSFAE
jgi:hypothetical protein